MRRAPLAAPRSAPRWQPAPLRRRAGAPGAARASRRAGRPGCPCPRRAQQPAPRAGRARTRAAPPAPRGRWRASPPAAPGACGSPPARPRAARAARSPRPGRCVRSRRRRAAPSLPQARPRAAPLRPAVALHRRQPLARLAELDLQPLALALHRSDAFLGPRQGRLEALPVGAAGALDGAEALLRAVVDALALDRLQPLVRACELGLEPLALGDALDLDALDQRPRVGELRAHRAGGLLGRLGRPGLLKRRFECRDARPHLVRPSRAGRVPRRARSRAR